MKPRVPRRAAVLSAASPLHFFAGVIVAGELRVDDPGGNLLRKVDYDPTPFVGATFPARF